MNPNIEPVAVDEFAPPVELELDRFIMLSELIHYVGMARSTVYKRIKTGDFPKQIHLQGSTTSVWSLCDIQQWQEEQKKGGAE